MGRPRQFDLEAVLNQVTETFWDKGYEATTTEDLELATGLKRGSLYNAFGDKHGLYLAALDHYSRVEMGQTISTFKQQDLFSDGIQSLFERIITQIETAKKPRGCLLCDAAVELSHLNEEVGKRVRSSYNHLRQAIIAKLASNKTQNNLKRMEQIADSVVNNYIGLRVLSKLNYPIEQLRNVANQSILSVVRAESDIYA